MNYVGFVWDYIFILFSFFCVYIVTRKDSKVWLYVGFIIYLPTVALFTFFIINEIITPSLDANIGFGGSIMLMNIVSIGGIIIAGIVYLEKRIRLR